MDFKVGQRVVVARYEWTRDDKNGCYGHVVEMRPGLTLPSDTIRPLVTVSLEGRIDGTALPQQSVWSFFPEELDHAD